MHVWTFRVFKKRKTDLGNPFLRADPGGASPGFAKMIDFPDNVGKHIMDSMHNDHIMKYLENPQEF
jgi:hypothetical protein